MGRPPICPPGRPGPPGDPSAPGHAGANGVVDVRRIPLEALARQLGEAYFRRLHRHLCALYYRECLAEVRPLLRWAEQLAPYLPAVGDLRPLHHSWQENLAADPPRDMFGNAITHVAPYHP
eukprot:EG_transcript_52282